jgi:predicted MFS family arabinose efflux permease
MAGIPDPARPQRSATEGTMHRLADTSPAASGVEAPGTMLPDRRRIAVALAGFCAFINLYSPQAVLPLLAQEFGVGVADISTTITAGTLAVAFIAPFTGTVADVIGRKRIIAAAMFSLAIPTAMVALAPDLRTMILWRLLQGLMLPPIFVVTVAYIAEEWPRREAVAVTGIYTLAAGLGGFFGRFLPGVLADLLDWRRAFMSLAAITLALAAGVAVLLPRERNFVGSEGMRASATHMLRHLRNPQLVATYAVGSGVLFMFVATFTYVNFLLAAPPFNLSPSLLGSIFVVYLVGAAMAPLAGRLVDRFGRRRVVVSVIGLWMCGLCLTLISSLPLIVLGLTISAACGFQCQTLATSFVATSAEQGHSSSVGLYVTCYYLGGSIGGALPGLAWNAAKWPGCVATMLVVLILMAVTVGHFWKGPPAPDRPLPG